MSNKLEEARKIGLSEILITCNDNNIGSAKVIENNGFILCEKIENLIDGNAFVTRRYRKTL